MRIGGLASGMDIDQLVGDLMKAERIPLNKMNQKKQILEWQRDDYRSMNSQLLSLRDLAFTMKLSSSYRTKSTTSSNESKVTATASPSAGNVSYTLSKVEQLATAATRVNGGKITSDKLDTNASLWSQQDKFSNNGFEWQEGGIAKDTFSVSDTNAQGPFKLKESNIKNIEDMQVKVNGKSYTVYTDAGKFTTATDENKVLFDKSTGELKFAGNLQKDSSITVDYFTDGYKQDITVPKGADTDTFQLGKGSLVEKDMTITVTKADGSTQDYTPIFDKTHTLGANEVYVDSATGKMTFSEKLKEDDKISASYKQNYFTFGIETYDEGGKPVRDVISVDGSNSFTSVMNKVNKSSAGVNMFYDDFSGKVTLTRSQTGDFNKNGAEINVSGGFLNNVLQFSNSTESGGQNAIFTINGLGTERSSNNFSINGVNFTLKDTFDSTTAGSTDAQVTIGVTTNTQDVFDNIKKFVDKYNETIDTINKKVNEERYRSYQPLSSEERKAMSDKEAELWDERAKSGLIKRDSTLMSGLTKFRQDLYSPVNNLDVGKFNQLASIGIKSTANYLDGGKLEIDEAKLRAAIEEDPESVEKLFTASGNTESEKGLVNRLYDSLTGTMDKISARAGKATWTNQQFTIGKNLESLKGQISSFEGRLKQVEDRYWRQFTAMEKAIQRSNQQSMYLMQQFGGGQ